MNPATMPPQPLQSSRSENSDKSAPNDATTQGFICMWHGLSVSGLLRMLNHRPQFAWSYSGRWASIAALSVINSAENAVESIVYGRKVARTQIQHPPIFILGHWRSGTTLLHNLMTLDPLVTFPNLYECMYPGHFLLTENVVSRFTGFFVPKKRPMDNMATGWKMPQEDEIALALDCGISPYLMLALHMRPDIYGRFFDPREMTPQERARWKRSLLTLMKKLTIRKNASIVMKSPSHTYRIPILLEMFPNAKFVYIYRDPYAVYKSTLHLRNTMFAENSLGPPNLSGTETEMIHFYDKCIRTYEETKSLIPKGNLHEVKFEELEVDPLGELAQTYRALNLSGWSEVEPAIRNELPSLSAYKKNSFRMDRESMEKIYSRFKWVFDLYGYSSRLENADAQSS